jgi:DNA-binding IclR family transcriptional regulator
VALALWGNFGPTIVRMIEANQPLLVAMRAGTVMSVFRTATGRAFASALPVARLARGGSAVGDSPRPAGRLSREEGEIVRQAREDVRRHGVVRAEGRPIPSVNAFSAPVFDHEGEPCRDHGWATRTTFQPIGIHPRTGGAQRPRAIASRWQGGTERERVNA